MKLVDNARTLATSLQALSEFDDTADLLLALADEIKRLEAENAKLRETIRIAIIEVARLEGENAQQRKTLAEYDDFARTATGEKHKHIKVNNAEANPHT